MQVLCPTDNSTHIDAGQGDSSLLLLENKVRLWSEGTKVKALGDGRQFFKITYDVASIITTNSFLAQALEVVTRRDRG